MSRERKPPKPAAGPPPGGERPGRKQRARTAAVMGMFSVDRKEGDVVVVVDEDGRATDVPSVRLPAQARGEGAVLRVPLDSAGMPSWEDAVRDRDEERRRRAMMAARIERLKRTDPGGDIEL